MTEPSYLPPPTPKKSSRKTLTIALAIVVVVVAAFLGAYLLTRSGGNNPTPGIESVTILSKTAFTSEAGYYTIVGEVKDNLGTNVENVKIVATFYDSSNTVIETSYAYTEIDILKPGQKSPFELSSYPAFLSPASYKLSVEYDLTQDQPFQGLMILNQTASISNGYHITVGEVKNNGTSKSTDVMIVGTYYNSAGTVIGTSWMYTELNEINAGGTSPFELCSCPLKINPATYELQIQGQ